MKIAVAPVHETINTGKPVYNDYTNIEKYYSIAGPDYSAWNRDLNMHFGYCKYFFDIFSLKKMLYRMNDEVLDRLNIPAAKHADIIDLGCGVGTVARYAAKKYTLAKFTGITIVDAQIKKGHDLIIKEKLEKKVRLIKNNFENIDFSDEIFDGAYAIESACHGAGYGKEFFIAEMARVLKTGGRFCVADGFLKTNENLPRLFNKIYCKILDYWALPCFGNIGDFTKMLRKYNLKNIQINEVSLRIAPSVAYVPRTCLKFIISALWKNKNFHLKKERWNNVKASILGMILGLYRKYFGYYIISGTK